MNFKFLIFMLLAGCTSTSQEKLGQVYYAVAPTLTGKIRFKSCKSFVVNDVLYHSSGDIIPLQNLVFIGQAPGQFGLESDVYETANLQIYRTPLYIELSGADYLETLVREDNIEEFKTKVLKK